MTSNEATILSELTRRPVAYHRAFAAIGGGTCAGLLLSQAYYWTPRTKDADGWFYKTQEEWEEETGLTRTEQETSRKRLKQHGLIEEKRAGVPARLFYRVNTENVLKALMALPQSSMRETCKLERAKPAILMGQNPQSITETTTEITTETTKAEAPGAGAPMPAVREVFSFWQSQCNRPQARLTAERERKIKARLKEGYSVDEIKQAITGCSNSPFHNGENKDGKVWNDLELILRSGAKMEGFMQTPQTKPRNAAVDRLVASLEREFYGTARTTPAVV